MGKCKNQHDQHLGWDYNSTSVIYITYNMDRITESMKPLKDNLQRFWAIDPRLVPFLHIWNKNTVVFLGGNLNVSDYYIPCKHTTWIPCWNDVETVVSTWNPHGVFVGILLLRRLLCVPVLCPFKILTYKIFSDYFSRNDAILLSSIL